jgi:hypothetical protein
VGGLALLLSQEHDQTSNSSRNNVNNGKEGIPAPDHDWHKGMFNITEDDIKVSKRQIPNCFA